MSIRDLSVAAGCALAVLTAAAIATGPPSATVEPAALAGPIVGAAHVAAAPTPLPKPKPKPKPAATAAPAANRTCAKGSTQSRIGGASKCLAAGQPCQQAHAADYARSGLTCTAANGVFRLRSKAGAPSRLAHPAAHKPGAPKPAAAPRKP